MAWARATATVRYCTYGGATLPAGARSKALIIPTRPQGAPVIYLRSMSLTGRSGPASLLPLFTYAPRELVLRGSGEDMSSCGWRRWQQEQQWQDRPQEPGMCITTGGAHTLTCSHTSRARLPPAKAWATWPLQYAHPGHVVYMVVDDEGRDGADASDGGNRQGALAPRHAVDPRHVQAAVCAAGCGLCVGLQV